MKYLVARDLNFLVKPLNLCLKYHPIGVFHTFKNSNPPAYAAFKSDRRLIARENFRQADAGCIVSNWSIWSPYGDWPSVHLPTWMLPA